MMDRLTHCLKWFYGTQNWLLDWLDPTQQTLPVTVETVSNIVEPLQCHPCESATSCTASEQTQTQANTQIGQMDPLVCNVSGTSTPSNPTASQLQTVNMPSKLQSYRISITYLLDGLFNACLRSVGQVVFADSSLAGIIILLGLACTKSWPFGILSSLGIIVAIMTSSLKNGYTDTVRHGLAGYNGCLVGCAIAVFMTGLNKGNDEIPCTWSNISCVNSSDKVMVSTSTIGSTTMIVACILVTVTSVLSVLIQNIWRVLTEPTPSQSQLLSWRNSNHLPLPMMTFPFNIALQVILLALLDASSNAPPTVSLRGQFVRRPTLYVDPVTNMATNLPYGSALTESRYGDTFGDVLHTMLLSCVRGTSQIYLNESVIAGSMIYLGLILTQWKYSLVAVYSAIIATSFAMLLGVNDDDLSQGLWSYNSILTGLGLYVLSPTNTVSMTQSIQQTNPSSNQSVSFTTTAILPLSKALFQRFGRIVSVGGWVVLTVLVQAACRSLLAPLGMPVGTLPFCFVCLFAFILRRASSRVMVVETMTDPIQSIHTSQISTAAAPADTTLSTHKSANIIPSSTNDFTTVLPIQEECIEDITQITQMTTIHQHTTTLNNKDQFISHHNDHPPPDANDHIALYTDNNHPTSNNDDYTASNNDNNHPTSNNDDYTALNNDNNHPISNNNDYTALNNDMNINDQTALSNDNNHPTVNNGDHGSIMVDVIERIS